MTEKSNGGSGGGSVGNLERLVSELRALSGEIESCAVISEPGELLYSTHPGGVERERTNAMLASLLGLSERVARESGRDHAAQMRVKTETGYFLMARLDNGGAIASTTGPDARVGLVLYDMRNARDGIENAVDEASGGAESGANGGEEK